MPVSPADLVHHQCLGFTHWKKRGGWRLQRSELSESMLPKSRFQSNNGQALRTAALAGVGIVMQPEILLGDDIANGRLIEVLKDFWPMPQPMHLIYPSDRQAVPKLTTFVDFILSQFGRR
jgi:DNA-binding transcriptional LysR family regulator